MLSLKDTVFMKANGITLISLLQNLLYMQRKYKETTQAELSNII